MARAESPSPVASRSTAFQSRVAPSARMPRRKSPTSLVPVIVAVARVLLEDLPGDVVVELELDHRADRVVVILRGIVVDMRLRRRVAESLGALAGGRDPLDTGRQVPTSRR